MNAIYMKVFLVMQIYETCFPFSRWIYVEQIERNRMRPETTLDVIDVKFLRLLKTGLLETGIHIWW